MAFVEILALSAALLAAPPAAGKKPAAKPLPGTKKPIVAAKKPAPPKAPPEAPLAFEDSPDGAVRGLLVALAERDPAALRAVTLSLPPADVKLLLGGAPVPAPDRGKALPLIAGMPMRQMQAGEEIDLGTAGGKFVAAPGMVGEGRAVVVPQHFPTPLSVRRVNGRWRVDAAPLVAAKKAQHTAVAPAAAPTP